MTWKICKNYCIWDAALVYSGEYLGKDIPVYDTSGTKLRKLGKIKVMLAIDGEDEERKLNVIKHLLEEFDVILDYTFCGDIDFDKESAEERCFNNHFQNCEEPDNCKICKLNGIKQKKKKVKK